LIEARPDTSHSPAAVGRNGEVPGDVECDAELGAKRPRQLDTHHRPEHVGGERPASHRKSIHGDPADESLAAEVEDDAAGKSQWRLIQHAGDRAWSEQALVELYPDVVERLGRVIDVVDPALAQQTFVPVSSVAWSVSSAGGAQ